MPFIQLGKGGKNDTVTYDATIFQTPAFGDRRGFKKVYRMDVKAKSHEEALDHLFKLFNNPDRIPKDYDARFIATGDIVFIDEGRKGHFYYQLRTGGWKSVHRIMVR